MLCLIENVKRPRRRFVAEVSYEEAKPEIIRAELYHKSGKILPCLFK